MAEGDKIFGEGEERRTLRLDCGCAEIYVPDGDGGWEFSGIRKDPNCEEHNDD